jgi:protein associated with RNAse G/E
MIIFLFFHTKNKGESMQETDKVFEESNYSKFELLPFNHDLHTTGALEESIEKHGVFLDFYTIKQRGKSMQETDKVYEESDYSKFDLLPFNRNLHTTDALEESMKTYGFLSFRPMTTVVNGVDRYLVKDGHHRLYVAKKLGIPVKFMIDNTGITHHEINGPTSTKWTLEDFIIGFSKEGIQDYKTILEYSQETGISLSLTLRIFTNEATSKTHYNAKMGLFKITESKSQETAYMIKKIVKKFNEESIKFNMYTIKALLKAMKNEIFDVEYFLSKIYKFGYMLELRNTIQASITVLEKFYNYKKRGDKLRVSKNTI